ncbi:Ig-like domain-containing protein, partial [bacterium]|nr:Ig-like domain-containing protein [bacterium]
EEDKTFTVNVIEPTLPTLQVVKNEINYEIGQDTTDIESIIVTLNGKDVTDKVNFTSTDENVATVDENGNINIIGEGETQIIIHLDGANDQIVTIKVTLPELEINKSEINLQVGQTEQLTVKLKGEDKTQNAVYQSSDPNIATVDENGNITAVGEGTAIIKVSVEGAKNAQINVNVYDPENHKIKCQSKSNIYETEDGFVMYKGETGNITVLIGGVDKTDSGYYKSKDETIVKVDNENEHGKMYALEIGNTSINLHHEEALEGDVTVNVIVKPKPQIEEDYMLIGNTQQIIFSGNAENWTFTSDDNNIATVDSSGKITSKGVNSSGSGTTVIHANDGIKTHDFTINTYKTLTNDQNGVSSTLLIDEQKQKMLTILMDTGMISNENDIQDIVQIDDNGMTEIKITIDREDGQKVAVVVYKDGTVKYISTETVQNGEITVNLDSSAQNTVAEENTSGTLETIVTPGFYNANDQLIASWDTVVNTWGWNYAKNWTTTQVQNTGSLSGHFYNVSNAHNILKSATKLVIPDGVVSFGTHCFYNCTLNLQNIVYPNTYTGTNMGDVFYGSTQYVINYTIRSDNPNFDSIDGVVYTENHKSLIVCPRSKTKVNVLEGTEKIVAGAFDYNKANSIGPIDSEADIKFPSSVYYITHCFRQMPNITWAELWEGLEESYGDSFGNCTKLKSIYIPATMKTIATWNNDIPSYYDMAVQRYNVKYYCSVSNRPSGWSARWNSSVYTSTNTTNTSYLPVQWNVSREWFRANCEN